MSPTTPWSHVQGEDGLWRCVACGSFAIPHQCAKAPIDYDEMEHCEAVALVDLRARAVERKLGPVASRLFDCVAWADIAALVAFQRNAAWAEGKVDGRREAEEDHAEYVKERADLDRVLGREGDQTLVEAARWNASEARVPPGFLRAAGQLIEAVDDLFAAREGIDDLREANALNSLHAAVEHAKEMRHADAPGGR